MNRHERRKQAAEARGAGEKTELHELMTAAEMPVIVVWEDAERPRAALPDEINAADNGVLAEVTTVVEGPHRRACFGFCTKEGGKTRGAVAMLTPEGAEQLGAALIEAGRALRAGRTFRPMHTLATWEGVVEAPSAVGTQPGGAS